MIISKPLKEISRKDLEELVSREVPEGKFIEYKLTLNDIERREFLKDISAFANSEGGDILCGVEERLDEKGKNTGPQGICWSSGPSSRR